MLPSAATTLAGSASRNSARPHSRIPWSLFTYDRSTTKQEDSMDSKSMLRKCFQILPILTRQQVYSILQPPRLLLSLKQSHTSVSFHAFRSREAVSQASRHKHDWKEKRLCKAGFPVTDFLHLTSPSGFRKSTACDCSTLMSPYLQRNKTL